MGLVSKDIAQAEIEKWIDYKKIGETKKEANKDQIDALADAIAQGSIVVKEDFTIVQELKFPIEDKSGVAAFKTLEYKPRLNMASIHLHLQGVKSSDADGRLCAHIAALTSKPKELIKKLDTEDYGIAQAIAIFFL